MKRGKREGSHCRGEIKYDSREVAFLLGSRPRLRKHQRGQKALEMQLSSYKTPTGCNGIEFPKTPYRGYGMIDWAYYFLILAPVAQWLEQIPYKGPTYVQLVAGVPYLLGL